MASIGHVAVGMAAARLLASRGNAAGSLVGSMIGLSALSMLPDIDVVGLAFGVPYGAPLGHRGASHSLVVAVAVGVLFGVAWLVDARSSTARVGALRLGVCVALVVASHGLLDAMTDGGKGVALLWPFTTHRYFFAWRPIPVAPIGRDFLSVEGLHVAAIEAAEFSAVFAYALWPRRRRAAER